MRLCRFLDKGRLHQGVWREGLLLDEAGLPHDPERVIWLLPFFPGKILGLALNYKDHAEELGLERPEEPALFWKPNSALLPHRGTVIYPKGVEFMHYEVELAVVIGRPMRKVRAKEAMEHVLGYTIANDLVVRDWVKNTFRPPIRATTPSCPLGRFWSLRRRSLIPMTFGLGPTSTGSCARRGTPRGCSSPSQRSWSSSPAL